MFSNEGWYVYLDEPMRELVDQSYYLLDHEEMNERELFDYSFIVFSMAKAYEGFLKKFFYDIGLIDLADYKGTFFRIGRSLNPDLPNKYRDEHWIYDDLQRMCESHPKGAAKEMPSMLWNAWRMGRNALFHYFPGKQEFIDLEEARSRVELIRAAIDQAVRCKGVASNEQIDSVSTEAQNIV